MDLTKLYKDECLRLYVTDTQYNNASFGFQSYSRQRFLNIKILLEIIINME